jgi:hypothetical protein
VWREKFEHQIIAIMHKKNLERRRKFPQRIGGGKSYFASESFYKITSLSDESLKTTYFFWG